MWRLRNWLLAFGVALAAAPMGSLKAQGGVELAPVLGVYVPLQSVIVQPDGTSAKQTTAAAIGARISAATHRKVGFDGTVTYVPSDVTASSGATGGSSSLVLIDARAVLSFGPVGSRTRFYVAGGPAVIIRNGEFYQDFGGTTDIGGNVAAGLRIALGKVSGRVEVEGYLYSASLTGAGNLTTGSELQTDLIISASVAIPLGSSVTPSP
jgi:hypothetical protein